MLYYNIYFCWAIEWNWRCFQTKALKKWMMEIKLNSWSLVWAMNPWIWTFNRYQNTEQCGRQGGPVRDSCGHVSNSRLTLESGATSDWFCNFPKIPNQRWEGKLSLILSLKCPLFPFFTQPSLAYFCHMYTQLKHYEQRPGRTFWKCVPLSLYLHD